jgi:pimeloyl-ACP methyl ester carboxylesterase
MASILADSQKGKVSRLRPERFDGAGHALFVYDPEKFNRVLGNFLATLPE